VAREFIAAARVPDPLESGRDFRGSGARGRHRPGQGLPRPERGGQGSGRAGAPARGGRAATRSALERGSPFARLQHRAGTGRRGRSQVHLDPAGDPHRRHDSRRHLLNRRLQRSIRIAGLGLLASITGAGCATLAPRSRPPGPDAHVVEGVPLRVFGADRCGPGSLSLVLNAQGDAVSEEELDNLLPKAPGGGVLSVDLLLAARKRGFEASLVAGTEEEVSREIEAARPVILMLRLLDAPGRQHDVYHYVVIDGYDRSVRLFRFQFGDGKARWASLRRLEKSWGGAGHALLLVRPRSDSDVAALRRGVGLERLGRPEEAAQLYREALGSHPESVRAWVDLGNAESLQGKREEAEKAYRGALALAPDDRDALNNLAWLLLEEGARLAEAEELATKAAGPPGADQAHAQDTLGRIWIAQGRCD